VTPPTTVGDRLFSYGELVVPVDTAVVLHITSTDVMHRWFIPALGGQVDAVPGKTAETWFRADREGVYRGQSTFFSGSGYAVMRAWVRVVSADAYQQYLRQKALDLAAAQKYVERKVTQSATPSVQP
jgi:cytochrome c oxidase subunit II